MDGEPDRTASVDQWEAGMRDAAKAHAAYFKQLLADGVSETAAVDLTVAYIDVLANTGQAEEEE